MFVQNSSNPFSNVRKLYRLDELIVSIELLEKGRSVVKLEGVDIDSWKIESSNCQFYLVSGAEVELSHIDN